MKERTLKTKLLTVLLTLCLALSFVPITAYAGVTDVTGDNTTNAYTHTYHTKVTTTAQVIIKDASGNVVETTEISKSGDFIEGNLSDDAVQAEIKRIDDEIKTQYSSRGSITIENCNSAMVFDHFESSNIFTPDDDIPVGDQDALENATSGSVNRHLDVYEYQVYQTTYDLIVQENNAAFKEITTVEIIGATLSYKPGETPRATAAVAAADQGKYRITYECWQELNENDVPVAVWYSDDGIYTTLPTITAFESGKKYVYSVLLMPEEYDFGRKVAATVNGNAVTAVPAVDGYLSLPNVKTMIPTADSHTHSYGTAWKYDETNHWQMCQRGHRGHGGAHLQVGYRQGSDRNREGLQARGMLRLRLQEGGS